MSSKQRIISIALSIVMMLSILPIGVFAAEATGFDNFVIKNAFAETTFTDVKTDDWYYGNVKAVYETGLMLGNSDTTFNPAGNVKISETITIAARLHALYTTGSDNFETSDPWYQTYVDYAKKNRIISDDYADYNKAATRAEFAMILANALPGEALPAVNIVTRDAVPDVKTREDCGEAVYKLYRAGILTGSDEKGTFNPESNIKRSEVATIVSRMADKELRKWIQLLAEGVDIMGVREKPWYDSGKFITKSVFDLIYTADNSAHSFYSWHPDEHCYEHWCEYEYDSRGVLAKLVGYKANGCVSTVSCYSETGDISTTIFTKLSYYGMRYCTNKAYYNEDNVLTSVVELDYAGNLLCEYEFDNENRCYQILLYDNGKCIERTVCDYHGPYSINIQVYDANGKLTESLTEYYSVDTYGFAYSEKFYYNENGKCIKYIFKRADGSRIETEYDGDGNVTKVTEL